MRVKLPPFETLLADHGHDVYRFLVASIGPADAQDCFQDVVVSALRAYPSLRDASNLRGWLFTVAHHRSIDLHRRRARQAFAPVSRQSNDTTPHDPSDAALWSAVRSLPAMQRAAVVCRYVDDLGYRDIGAVIGCSEAAARQNVRAGLATLRRSYGAAHSEVSA